MRAFRLASRAGSIRVMTRNPWISDLHWVRRGRQSRSQRTQEAILDSAESLFAEKGTDASSMADVAAGAGCSVGAVYHHFRDKRALIYALFDRVGAEFRATTRKAVDPARWERASIQDILKGYLEFSLELGRARPGFQRASLEASLRDEKVRENLAEANAELERGLTELLLARRHEIGHPDPSLATAFVLGQLASMLETRLDDQLFRSRFDERSDDAFIREALRSVCAYLQLETPTGTSATDETA